MNHQIKEEHNCRLLFCGSLNFFFHKKENRKLKNKVKSVNFVNF